MRACSSYEASYAHSPTPRPLRSSKIPLAVSAAISIRLPDPRASRAPSLTANPNPNPHPLIGGQTSNAIEVPANPVHVAGFHPLKHIHVHHHHRTKEPASFEISALPPRYICEMNHTGVFHLISFIIQIISDPQIALYLTSHRSQSPIPDSRSSKLGSSSASPFSGFLHRHPPSPFPSTILTIRQSNN